MCKRIQDEHLVSILCFVAALLIGGCVSAQHQYPTADVPTSEPACIAKVKTAGARAYCEQGIDHHDAG
jgi:hypothetical protein